MAVSCSPNAANTILRQLDMELISLKRQVSYKSGVFYDFVHLLLFRSNAVVCRCSFLEVTFFGFWGVVFVLGCRLDPEASTMVLYS